MDIILKYFPDLSERQVQQFQALESLYKDWNSKINVISRKDIDNLYVKHVLHSLSIAKVLDFKAYTHILDVGTGGGFPTIPLAILYPEAKFYAIDTIAKKIKVVKAVVEALGLRNVVAEQKRVQNLEADQYDFVLCRGVAKLPVLLEWTKKLVVKEAYNHLDNGLLLLKGGDLTEEIKSIRPQKVRQFAIADFFEDSFFAEKYILYIKK